MLFTRPNNIKYIEVPENFEQAILLPDKQQVVVKHAEKSYKAGMLAPEKRIHTMSLSRILHEREVACGVAKEKFLWGKMWKLVKSIINGL